MAALFDVAAPAKLNLFLHVVGRRADGYHLLESLMVLIDWSDLLHFERRRDGRIARHDLGAALPADDLCLRAARALQSASATSEGADITIDKRLPTGAGLGGGSSDAATTLLALNRLWRLDWTLSQLLPIGIALGADVPFFLAGANALAEGIGEKLTPVEVPPSRFAVIKPPAGLQTRAVFAHRRVAERVEAARIAGFPEAASAIANGHAQPGETEPELFDGFGRNDLQAAAEDLCPDVARAAALLLDAFGNSRMTGSGSAVFARAGHATAPTVASPPEVPEGWASRWCRSLPRHPLQHWVQAADRG
ncbi:MAG: 4-(cytidine 5'-diphospho)-2-C-methyl-D-erythritol kinase [Caldimonas sp.]